MNAFISCPSYFFPYSLFSACHLSLSLCLISSLFSACHLSLSLCLISSLFFACHLSPSLCFISSLFSACHLSLSLCLFFYFFGSHTQVLGTALTHEIHMFCSHIKWNLLSSHCQYGKFFVSQVLLKISKLNQTDQQ